MLSKTSTNSPKLVDFEYLLCVFEWTVLRAQIFPEHVEGRVEKLRLRSFDLSQNKKILRAKYFFREQNFLKRYICRTSFFDVRHVRHGKSLIRCPASVQSCHTNIILEYDHISGTVAAFPRSLRCQLGVPQIGRTCRTSMSGMSK